MSACSPTLPSLSAPQRSKPLHSHLPALPSQVPNPWARLFVHRPPRKVGDKPYRGTHLGGISVQEPTALKELRQWTCLKSMSFPSGSKNFQKHFPSWAMPTADSVDVGLTQPALGSSSL